MRMRCSAWLVGGVVGAVAALTWTATAQAQPPTADTIVLRMLERNAERQQRLQHYASDRTYHLEYNGVGGQHHAEMVVHADYRAPGRKHLIIVAESGSKVLCAEVLRKLVKGEEETSTGRDWQRGMFSPATYNLELLGREDLDGIATWVLRVEPKAPSKVAYRGKIWVSTEDYATVRMVAEPAQNPSWMLDHASFEARYMRRGEVWLPERNISTTHVRLGGDAKVTIDYGEYPVVDTLPLQASSTARAAGESLSLVPLKIAAKTLR